MCCERASRSFLNVQEGWAPRISRESLSWPRNSSILRNLNFVTYSQESVIEPRRDLGDWSTEAYYICLINENLSQ
jgi:hypothetical protein